MTQKKKKPVATPRVVERGLPPAKLYECCAGLAEAARRLQREERATQLFLKFESKGKPN